MKRKICLFYTGYLAENQSKEEKLVKNAVCRDLPGGRHQRVKESYQCVSNWPFPHKKSQIQDGGQKEIMRGKFKFRFSK